MNEVYLNFNGKSGEAAAYYAQIFEAPAPYAMRFSDMPQADQTQMPPGSENLVMYANVKTSVGDIMMSDAMPGTTVIPSEGVWINYSMKDQERLRQYFDAMARDGEVQMPLDRPSSALVWPGEGQAWVLLDFYEALIGESAVTSGACCGELIKASRGISINRSMHY